MALTKPKYPFKRTRAKISLNTTRGSVNPILCVRCEGKLYNALKHGDIVRARAKREINGRTVYSPIYIKANEAKYGFVVAFEPLTGNLYMANRMLEEGEQTFHFDRRLHSKRRKGRKFVDGLIRAVKKYYIAKREFEREQRKAGKKKIESLALIEK
jgi:hypothetical protein